MNEKKEILTSLYNNIDIHSSITEIFENNIENFNRYFGNPNTYDSLLKEIPYIISYGCYEIFKFRDEYIELFSLIIHGVRKRIFRDISIDTQQVLNIKYDIDEFLFGMLEVFEKELSLDICGLIKEKEAIPRNLSYELYTFIKKDFHEEIEKIKGVIKKDKTLFDSMEFELNNYQIIVWNVKKQLLQASRNRENISYYRTIDNILMIRETFMEATDTLIKNIKDICEKFIYANIDSLIRVQLGNKLQNKLQNYKLNLSQLLNTRSQFEDGSNYISIPYKKINIYEANEYMNEVFKNIFMVEYDFLNILSQICKIRFEAIMDYSKYNLNTLFMKEFEGLIYYINGDKDFGRIYSAFEEKIYYMVYKFVSSIFEEIKIVYYNHFIEILDKKKVSFDNMYFFRCIRNYTQYVNNYDTSKLIDIKNKIEEVYNVYKDKSIMKDNFPIVLNLYNIDDTVPKIFFREYIHNSEEYKKLFNMDGYIKISDLEKRKIHLRENIMSFKHSLWEKVYNDLVGYFDSMFNSIIRNRDYIIKISKKYDVF